MIIDQVLLQKAKTQEGNSKNDKNNNDSAKRSFAKTVSWRIIGTLDTILISWIITGAFTFAISIGAIEFFSKMILYFFHERVWNTINYGK